MSVFEIFLGVMTSLGGFVDIGEAVFTGQAGARFGYATLWVVALGTIGIALYTEMAGRIAAVQRKAVFDLVREQLDRPLSRVTLVASTAVNVITCAAEIGGMAMIIRLLEHIEYHTAVLIATLLLVIVLATLPFRWIERFFGLLGLGMLTFGVAAVRLTPDWRPVLAAFVPHIPPLPADQRLVFLYFVVGIFSSVMMAYEVYFYASGAIEDHWSRKSLPMNVIIAGAGSALGSLLAIALVLLGRSVFQPAGITPDFIDTMAMAAAGPFGRTGLVLGLLGMFFAIAGAAAETSLAGAYNYAQYFELPWGRAKSLKAAPRFNLAWLAMIAGAMLIILTGVDPLNLVEYSVIFSAVLLPLTYWSILKVAGSRQSMREHANSRPVQIAGWIFLVLVTIAALAGVPLMIVTHAGQG
jgi:manganese transport protein